MVLSSGSSLFLGRSSGTGPEMQGIAAKEESSCRRQWRRDWCGRAQLKEAESCHGKHSRTQGETPSRTFDDVRENKGGDGLVCVETC